MLKFAKSKSALTQNVKIQHFAQILNHPTKIKK
jgi:hypothetical protein